MSDLYEPYRNLFEYVQPRRILYGFDAVKEVGEEAKALTEGRKAQIITDKGIVKAGIVDEVQKPLENAGFRVEIWDKTDVEPTEKCVMQGAEDVRDFNADVFIGVGGGSSMDEAKMVAGMMTNPKPVREYFDEETMLGLFQKQPKPIMAIPTTAGTGSEVTQFAVLSFKDVPCGKVPFFDTKIIPSTAILDPALTLTLPSRATASTGLDALGHLIEPYLSKKTNPYNEALALQGARLITEYLPRAVYSPDDYEARANMLLQASLGGLAINFAFVMEAHVISHILGSCYHDPHGVCVGIPLPYAMEYNLQVFPKELRKLATAMGRNVNGLTVQEAAYEAVFAVVELIESVGMPTKLSQLEGVKKGDMAELAHIMVTAPYPKGGLPNCRRKSTEEDYRKLFEKMYEGKIGLIRHHTDCI